jgi:UPF0716 protein FxsA
VGAALARHQGLGTLARLQRDLAEGRLPGEPLVEGVLILVAGAVLLTPGVLTDAVGFLLLVPPFRRLIIRLATRRFERAVREGTVRMSFGGQAAPFGPPMKNVTPPRPEDDRRRDAR